MPSTNDHLKNIKSSFYKRHRYLVDLNIVILGICRFWNRWLAAGWRYSIADMCGR